MQNAILGAALLPTGVLAVFLLRPKSGKERPIVRFPGAWIVIGLLLTFWIATGMTLLATSLLGL